MDENYCCNYIGQIGNYSIAIIVLHVNNYADNKKNIIF